MVGFPVQFEFESQMCEMCEMCESWQHVVGLGLWALEFQIDSDEEATYNLSLIAIDDCAG